MRACAAGGICKGGTCELPCGISFSSTLLPSEGGELLCATPLARGGVLNRSGDVAGVPKISSGEAEPGRAARDGLPTDRAGLGVWLILDGLGRGLKLSARFAMGFPSSRYPPPLTRVPKLPLTRELSAPSGTSRRFRRLAIIASPAPSLPSWKSPVIAVSYSLHKKYGSNPNPQYLIYESVQPKKEICHSNCENLLCRVGEQPWTSVGAWPT